MSRFGARRLGLGLGLGLILFETGMAFKIINTRTIHRCFNCSWNRYGVQLLLKSSTFTAGGQGEEIYLSALPIEGRLDFLRDRTSRSCTRTYEKKVFLYVSNVTWYFNFFRL